METILWSNIFFLLFALLTCGFAVAVTLSTSMVRMAIYLIASLASTSGLFFLAGAEFVALTQLMVYVGGTLVLLIFGVMLTHRGPQSEWRASGGHWVMATILAAALLALMTQTVFSVVAWRNAPPLIVAEKPWENAPTLHSPEEIGFALMGIRVDQARQPDVALRDGMSGYLLPFEIVSVHLLVALIGAAYLGRARRRVGADEMTEN